LSSLGFLIGLCSRSRPALCCQAPISRTRFPLPPPTRGEQPVSQVSPGSARGFLRPGFPAEPAGTRCNTALRREPASRNACTGSSCGRARPDGFHRLAGQDQLPGSLARHVNAEYPAHLRATPDAAAAVLLPTLAVVGRSARGADGDLLSFVDRTHAVWAGADGHCPPRCGKLKVESGKPG